MTKGPVAEGLGLVEELSEAGRYEAALEELDQQVMEHPLEPAVHTARGWALENLGSAGLPRARDAYSRALELDPTALWAKEGLSNVYRRMGDVEEANRLAREVIDEGTPRSDEEIDLRELVGVVPAAAGPVPGVGGNPSSGTPARWTVDGRQVRPRPRAHVRGRPRQGLPRIPARDRSGGQRGRRTAARRRPHGSRRPRGVPGRAPALAATREAIAARDLLQLTLRVATMTA